VTARVLALTLAAVGLVWAAPAPLAIVNIVVHDIEDGPPIPPGFSFVPGQFIFLSFQIAGYGATPERKLRLNCEVDAFDPKGIRIVETLGCNVAETLADEDKNWKPKIRLQALIPPLAGSGAYKIAIRIKDDVNGQTAEQELPFLVRGRDVPPSDNLVVRNFHFYRGEDDPNPLAAALYRPGDTLWARFDITGYRFGDGNAIHVDYRIAVLGPGGKVIYTQPEGEIAVEKSISFYPKPYVPGAMNLSLQRTIRPGQYAIAVTARDLLGNQSVEITEKFSIEQ
jgi:hypothetical protein